MLKTLRLSLVLSLGLSGAATAAYDVVVYGDTLAGISAAIQATRMQKSVVLLSPTAHLGGVATAGLTATDMNRSPTIGGIAREFYGKIYDHYLQPSAWRGQTRAEFFELSLKRTYTGKNDALRMQWVYESHVAEKILESMLRTAGVAVVRRSRIAENASAVELEAGRIVALRTESGERFAGRMFVDASYEGDLMARAGVSSIIGRESNSAYGETMNGIRLAGVVGAGERSVDPWIRPGDPTSGLLPYIDRTLWGRPGEGDARTQTYCYRLTLTNDPANRLPIVKPANFNPLWHEVMVRTLQMAPDTPLQKVMSLTPMPNRKTDTNQVNFIGANRDYQAASHRERERIDQMHRDYAIGTLWVLANDERVPAPIREEMKPWGWPKDEFTDNGNFPHQLYIREARRMRGVFVMKEENLRREGRVDAGDPVAIGSYMLDSHVVSRVLDADGRLRNEGSHLDGRSIRPYGISYFSLVPQKAECRNLLVPVCLSSTHVAYTSIRMEPVYMVLGQAAGAAAALALDSDLAVQDVPYPKLNTVLAAAGQIMALPQ
ncbi:MAG: xanthan lyase [Opitutia bacterium]|nr:MAG: xanthan lyase [Opitutae bacterium]